MEPMLDERIQKQVKEVFGDLHEPVEVLFFGSQGEDRYQTIQDTHRLLEEVTALSEKLTLQVYDLEQDAKLAAHYHVEAAPTLVVAAKNEDSLLDYGIRYKGIPAGHEFTSLINSLLIVSKRDSGLMKETREYLRTLDKPVHLQVFTTPT